MENLILWYKILFSIFLIVLIIKFINNNMLLILNNLLKLTNFLISKLLNKEEDTRGWQDLSLTLIAIRYSEGGRFLEFYLSNNKLLTHKNLLYGIHNTLFNNKEFLNFGDKKVFIITAIIQDIHFNFHHNVLVNNYTDFETYYNLVKEHISSLYTDNKNYYITDEIPLLKVIVWNMDLHTNKDIKITRNSLLDEAINNNINKAVPSSINYYLTQTKLGVWRTDAERTCLYPARVQTRFLHHAVIKPLKSKATVDIMQKISTLDIETMEYTPLDKNDLGEVKAKTQIPVIISLSNKELGNKIFIIDHKLMRNTNNVSLAITLLWKECFNYIYLHKDYYNNIFVHNLGGFDGYFIYKHLCEYTNSLNVSSIIDNQNRFIQIVWTGTYGYHLNHLKPLGKFKITFKDSFRIFPISLNELCSQFDVKGKLSAYDPIYNNLNIFNSENNQLLNKFKNYAKQDSLSLLNALTKAQHLYFNDYKVDLATTLLRPAPSLSLKIFRTNFLDKDIPILNKNEDNFIRDSYFGGATDYYKAHVKNAKFYDVNSLYPRAMLQPIPYKIKKYHNDLSKTKLDDFFGFCLVEVETPKTLKPLLPYKDNNKTIFPTGKWSGVYFSEELKALTKYGYKFKLIRGYEFYHTYLFDKYVNHFFDRKKNSTGSNRYIAKLHLNMLYGIFGRKINLIETVNIKNEDIIDYAATHIIKAIIKINDNFSTLLLETNINHDILLGLNSILKTDVNNNYHFVKSNVAIASAITAYARIHMIEFKLDPGCVYTDTDSIFTTNNLSNEYLSEELGYFKDELKGNIIQEAYFLGVKQYGYWYYDVNNNNEKIEKSVFAGIDRNTIPFKDIIKIFNGETLYREQPMRFFKSLSNLNISIKPIKVSLKFAPNKKLINNIYYPKEIYNTNHPFLRIKPKQKNKVLLTKLVNKILKWIKIYKV